MFDPVLPSPYELRMLIVLEDRHCKAVWWVGFWMYCFADSLRVHLLVKDVLRSYRFKKSVDFGRSYLVRPESWLVDSN